MAFEMPGSGDDEEHGAGRRRGERDAGHSGGGPGGGGARTGHLVPPRRTKALAVTLVILVALIVGFLLFDTVYTSYLWFKSVGFSSVYRTRLTTQISLFVIFGLAMGLAIAANIWLAYRFRPPLTGVSLEQQALDRYRLAVAPFRKLILPVVGGLIGVLAGIGALNSWRLYLLWANAVPFGQQDAQFHKDIGFYVFTLPWLRHVQGFLLSVVILCLISALVTHYLYAGIALTPPGGPRPRGSRGLGGRVTRAAQVHISILLGLLVLVKAYAYWLDRYQLSVAASKITDGWAGPTYKSVHAVLPAKNILMVIALMCAVLFFGNAVRLIGRRNSPDISSGGHTWALPALGVSLMILSSVVIGGVYPLVVQTLQVNPSQAVKEAPYIQRNIDATRAAYGLSDVQIQNYDAKTTVAPGQLAKDAATVAQIRVMDPALISATFDQLQQVKGFYTFPSDLAVDRYTLNGSSQDAVVAVRDLNLAGAPASQRNWVNDHLKYTHGYGFVAAKGNTSDGGKPDFVEKDIPSTGDLSAQLGAFEQRVYFGQGSPDYSIVGGTAKSTPAEFDYPDDTSPTQQVGTTYTGTGGVPVGSFFDKLLYAVKFKEMKILLSNGVNQDSRIIYDRDPKQRVQAVAPWLTVDGTTYPAVVNGRIVWIVDGYTTTAAYPAATRTEFSSVARDSLTGSSGPLGAGEVNYIRNSVKATVDAYDGTVTLYQWDETDPLLKVWMKAFPGTVKPKSAISPQLMEHLRYPQDLFKAQRQILSRYHVTDPGVFFTGSAFWQVPPDPTKIAAGGTGDQPPYYLTLQMPGQAAPAFSLTSTLVPVNRQNLGAFVAVDADTGGDYGKIRVLELTTSQSIPGPSQVQNSFHSNADVAKQINSLKIGTNTTVVEGNLLTLPVGGGLLYVEPIYAQSTGNASYPLLQAVLASFGNQIAFGPTLQSALDNVFQGNSGATTGETPGTTPSPGTTTPPPTTGAVLSPQLQAAIDAVTKAQADLNTALAKTPTDWVAIGQAQKNLQDAIAALAAAENTAKGQ